MIDEIQVDMGRYDEAINNDNLDASKRHTHTHVDQGQSSFPNKELNPKTRLSSTLSVITSS